MKRIIDNRILAEIEEEHFSEFDVQMTGIIVVLGIIVITIIGGLLG
jgi:hypothetical protein